MWPVEGRDLDLVVDTSMGLRPLRSMVERELGGEPLAVATHSHVDHSGGLHEFEERAAHPAVSAVLEQAGLASVDTAHYPESVLGPYRDADYATGDRLVDAVPPDGPAATVYAVAAAPATRLIDEGDVIDDYRATMERLRTLPVSVVHAGQETSFGRRRLVELCDAYLA